MIRIRTEWFRSSEDIARTFYNATGLSVARVTRTTGLWCDLRLQDGQEIRLFDNQPIASGLLKGGA